MTEITKRSIQIRFEITRRIFYETIQRLAILFFPLTDKQVSASGYLQTEQ